MKYFYILLVFSFVTSSFALNFVASSRGLNFTDPCDVRPLTCLDQAPSRNITTHFPKVLVIVAHPDDAEFNAGGTISRLIEEGSEVRYLILTNGNKGRLY